MNQELITASHYPKIALMDVKNGCANGIIFWSQYGLKPEDKDINRWVTETKTTTSPSKDKETYDSELYDPIGEILETLDDTQAAMAEIFASDYSGGTAYITLMYPIFKDKPGK